MLYISLGYIFKRAGIFMLALFASTSFVVEASVYSLSDDEPIISSYYKYDRLWFLTSTEAGYYVGSSRYSLDNVNSLSHMFLGMSVDGDTLYIEGATSLISYNLLTEKVSELKQINVNGEMKPVRYALSSQIYDGMIYFVQGEKIVEVSPDFSESNTLYFPTTHYSSKQLSLMQDDEYEDKRLSHINRIYVDNTGFYAFTIMGSLLHTNSRGKKAELLLSRKDFPELREAYAYEISKNEEANKLFLSTSKGLYIHDLLTSETVRKDISPVYKVEDRNSFYRIYGNKVYDMDKETFELQSVYDELKITNIYKEIEINGGVYIPTEFDGIKFLHKENFQTKYLDIPSNNALLVYKSEDNSRDVIITDSLIKIGDKKFFQPLAGKRPYWEIEERFGYIVIYTGDSVLINTESELRSIPVLKNEFVTFVRMVAPDTLMVSYKDSPSQFFNIETNETVDPGSFIKSRPWRDASQVKFTHISENYAVLYRNQSNFHLINKVSNQGETLEAPGLDGHLLVSENIFDTYLAFGYKPKHIVILDFDTLKTEAIEGYYDEPVCIYRHDEFIFELNSQGGYVIYRPTEPPVSTGSINDLSNINKTKYFIGCKEYNKGVLAIPGADGITLFDIDLALLNSNNELKPVVDRALENSIILSDYETSTTLSILPNYPRGVEGLELFASVNGNIIRAKEKKSLQFSLPIVNLSYGENLINLYFTDATGKKIGKSASYHLYNPLPVYFHWSFIALYISMLILVSFLIAKAINISQRKKATVELARSKERTLNAIAHDIKAPLTAIFSAKEMVASGDLDKVTAYETLLPNVQVLQYISTNLLSINEINQKGELSLTSAAFNLGSFLTTTINAAKAIANTKQIEITFCNPIDDSVHIKGDLGKIAQAVLNVISNAVKYSVHQSIIDITVSYNNKSSILGFIIQDYGKGIPKDDLQRITKLYEQASNSNGDGQGLGLFISNEICKAHGGEIEFQSKLDYGTRVKLTFVCPNDMPALKPIVAPFQSKSSAVTKTVILLEDDPIQAMYFTNVMAKKGVEVKTYNEVSKFMQSLKDLTPDAVVTDHMIGHSHINLTGLDVVKDIRKHNESIVIAAITDQVDLNVKGEYEDLGCIYISKNAATLEADVDQIVKKLYEP